MPADAEPDPPTTADDRTMDEPTPPTDAHEDAPVKDEPKQADAGEDRNP